MRSLARLCLFLLHLRDARCLAARQTPRQPQPAAPKPATAADAAEDNNTYDNRSCSLKARDTHGQGSRRISK